MVNKKYSLLFLFLLSILSSCGKVTVHNQTHQLEKLTTSSRKQVEKEISNNIDNIIGNNTKEQGFWELCPYQYYSEEIYHYLFQVDPNTLYACKSKNDLENNIVTPNITPEKDLFLDFYISSDYFGQPSRLWDYPPTRIDLCNHVEQFKVSWGYEYALAYDLIYFSDTRQNITDNLLHYIGRMSIPFMIKQGLISQDQQDLCIYNSDSDEAGDAFFIFGGDGNRWTFNLLRIDKSQIEQIMQELEDKGIVYQYPQ